MEIKMRKQIEKNDKKGWKFDFALLQFMRSNWDGYFEHIIKEEKKKKKNILFLVSAYGHIS